MKIKPNFHLVCLVPTDLDCTHGRDAVAETSLC